jgi:hypothetical protein
LNLLKNHDRCDYVGIERSGTGVFPLAFDKKINDEFSLEKEETFYNLKASCALIGENLDQEVFLKMLKLINLFFEEKGIFSLSNSQKDPPLSQSQRIVINGTLSSDRELVTHFFD